MRIKITSGNPKKFNAAHASRAAGICLNRDRDGLILCGNEFRFPA
jgi:hypothetical protein